MGRTIIQRAEVQEDLVEIFVTMGRGSQEAARRFLKAADETFQRLAAMPGLGERFESDHPELANIRRSIISGFKRYVVYYQPIDNGIEVLRVLHGARDLGVIFGTEAGE